MTDVSTPTTALSHKPKRADARRNYDKLLATAAEVFTERGGDASLEDIARRAGVGIGTLYRHFPTRQALLEAVYVGEVEEISRKAADFADLEPWDALSAWLREYARFAVTKKVVSNALLATMDNDAPVFATCRESLTVAGESLLGRAQAAGAVRADAQLLDVLRMVGGIATIATADHDQVERILDMALDGLRAR
jgi:AcrR family transcriptional regulator